MHQQDIVKPSEDSAIGRSRRAFLVQTSAVVATTFASGLLKAQPKRSWIARNSTTEIPSRDTRLKFTADGHVRPFAGNSVICHLPVQCAMRSSIINFRDALTRSSFRHKLALTTPESYHMTIFSGANDQDRNETGWPSYVSSNASMEVCNQMVGDRMANLRLACELPLRVRIDHAATFAAPAACLIHMEPVDAAENTRLRSVRDQLSEAYGIHRKDHANYAFHITVSYQLSTFSEREEVDYQTLLRDHVRLIAEATPILELGNPEFCTFPDMSEFNPVKLISCV